MIFIQLLGTKEWFVIHHSDCGMVLFDDATISSLLEHDLETANIDSNGVWSPATNSFTGSSEGKYIKWQTFKNLEVSILYYWHLKLRYY